MRQVLFFFPLHYLGLPDLPIYGYGTMLFVAFVWCAWVGGRLAQREGIAKDHLYDISMWTFISGLIGARITFMIQYWEQFQSLWQFFAVWDGGLIFYGGFIGGTVGYFLGYFLIFRKHHISSWKVADIIGVCLALGLALGRMGCFLNGCCYGNVACVDCPAVHFPLPSPPRYAMVERGYQTAAGFLLKADGKPTVEAVEPDSPAQRAGLKRGDLVVSADDKQIEHALDLSRYLRAQWPRGKNDLELTIRRENGAEESLNFRPLTIGLHPTQLYETVSMGLLTFVLLSYYPFKRRDGSVMVLFMLAYAVHRFLNEMLRTDTEKVAFNLTLSQNISILVFSLGVLLGLIILSRKTRPAPQPAPQS